MMTYAEACKQADEAVDKAAIKMYKEDTKFALKVLLIGFIICLVIGVIQHKNNNCSRHTTSNSQICSSLTGVTK